MFLAQFLTVAVVHFLAVASPGPDFAVVTRNSLVYTRKIGIYTALGVGIGIGVHVAYSLLGIAFVISQSVILFNVIKYVGATYLVYIGVKSLIARRETDAKNKSEFEKAQEDISLFAAIRTGFLTNVLNPKATLFFLALFTQVISPATPKFIQFLYGLEMMTATFVWFSLVSLLFSNQAVKAKISKFQHYLERITGAVLVGLGIKVALSGSE